MDEVLAQEIKISRSIVVKLTKSKLKQMIKEELSLLNESAELSALEHDLADTVFEIDVWVENIGGRIQTPNAVRLANKRGVGIKALVTSTNLLRKKLKKMSGDNVEDLLKRLGFDYLGGPWTKRYPISDYKKVAQALAKLK